MGIGVFSGDQSFSHDQQVELMEMSGETLGTHFGVVDSNQVKSSFSRAVPVFSGWFFQFFPVYTGFFSFLDDRDENLESSTPGEYQPLWPPDPDEGSTTGHLWWSLMGGEVTNMCHISRCRCEP